MCVENRDLGQAEETKTREEEKKWSPRFGNGMSGHHSHSTLQSCLYLLPSLICMLGWRLDFDPLPSGNMNRKKHHIASLAFSSTTANGLFPRKRRVLWQFTVSFICNYLGPHFIPFAGGRVKFDLQYRVYLAFGLDPCDREDDDSVAILGDLPNASGGTRLLADDHHVFSPTK